MVGLLSVEVCPFARLPLPSLWKDMIWEAAVLLPSLTALTDLMCAFKAGKGVLCPFFWKNDVCEISGSVGEGAVWRRCLFCTLGWGVSINSNLERKCREVYSQDILTVLMGQFLWHPWQPLALCHAFFSNLPFRPSGVSPVSLGATPGEVLWVIMTHLASFGFLTVNWANEWNY